MSQFRVRVSRTCAASCCVAWGRQSAPPCSRRAWRTPSPATGSGGAAEHGDQSAARLRRQGRAHDLLHRSRCAHHRSFVRWPAPAQRADPAAVDRCPVVGRPGLELGGPLPRLERHPQQPPDALARGRRPRQRVPLAVEQQQRQHLRLPGAAVVLRAPGPPRGALRARRLGHDHRRDVQRQAPELAQRRGAASRRQLLVHRSALRRPVLRGHGGRRRRAGQQSRAHESAAGPAARVRQLQARVADGFLPRRPERHHHPGR